MSKRVYGVICQQCGKKFNPERSSAKFCSDKCRVASHRQLHATSKGDKLKIMMDSHDRLADEFDKANAEYAGNPANKEAFEKMVNINQAMRGIVKKMADLLE